MGELIEKSGKITEKAEKVLKLTKRQKIFSVLLSVVVLFLILVYIISLLYSGSSSLTISVNKFDKSRLGLSLSEHRNFNVQTSRLNAKPAEEVTNISGSSLPDILDGEGLDGSHNGKDYLAYTFYLMNTGEDAVSVNYYMKIVDIRNELDSAIRIRVYFEGEAETFAKVGTNGEAEENTEPFVGINTVFDRKLENFAPNDTRKYTVIIWLEGDDPDCNDGLIGGSLKAEVFFDIVENA